MPSPRQTATHRTRVPRSRPCIAPGRLPPALEPRTRSTSVTASPVSGCRPSAVGAGSSRSLRRGRPHSRSRAAVGTPVPARSVRSSSRRARATGGPESGSGRPRPRPARCQRDAVATGLPTAPWCFRGGHPGRGSRWRTPRALAVLPPELATVCAPRLPGRWRATPSRRSSSEDRRATYAVWAGVPSPPLRRGKSVDRAETLTFAIGRGRDRGGLPMSPPSHRREESRSSRAVPQES